MSSHVNYAIIGSGMMGREHIQNISLLGDTQVAALFEPDREQLSLSASLAPHATIYHDLSDLIKDSRVDAFVIASPNHTHVDILREILANDARAVLVEKPLCTTVDDCRTIAELADSYRAPIWVAMEYRYMPPVAELMSRVKDGQVGEPKMIGVQEHRFPFLKKVGDWNRFNVNTGGTLVEKCCHFFDLMRLIANDQAVRVYGSGAPDVNFLNESYGGKTPDMIDNAFVIVDFASGIRACLSLCMFCDGSYFQEEISVLGEKGKLECLVPGPDRLWAVDDLDDLGHTTGFTGIHRDSEIVYSPRRPKGPVRETVKVDTSLQLAGDHQGSTFYQHQKFYDVVCGNGTVEVTLDDGLQAVLIGLAAEQSIREHQAVEIASL
ncbi:MAG: Gfo/Idh/MocA family oxidoreductase [Desulfofustis sp.]|nr:Gfo/Idh/MocA family oxidoreductase [Desulfofustis sp.]